MARPKKGDEKAKAGATIEIDVDSFVRTRDAFVTGLATLQDAIQTLSTSYIKHANAVLGEHGAGLDVGATLSKLGDNPLLALTNLPQAASPATGVAATPAEGAAVDKKERKKRQHDPNAPKRPLTPFFLYMQTARPIIANDLGAEVPKGAVSTEGTRRWKEMLDPDRLLWTNAYKENLRIYNARMHAYKVGNNPNAKDMSDEEAQAYAELHNIAADTTADAQLAGEAGAAIADAEVDADAEGEPEKEPTPPPKTPKTKAARKPKGAKATPAESSVPVSASAPPAAAIVPKEKEPAKKDTPATGGKRKRASKKADEPATEAVEEAAVEMPKSAPKPRKKKAKGDA